jgi:hypothetical protein
MILKKMFKKPIRVSSIEMEGPKSRYPHEINKSQHYKNSVMVMGTFGFN